jgi:nicotinamide-nucleotide amidase
MRAELINTGSELLLGNVVNTHLSWLGRELFPIGLRIARQTTVPDGSDIGDAITDSLARGTKILLVTGGLGPTGDDLTREICADLFHCPLEFHSAVLESIRERLARRNIELRENMKRQALVPSGAEVLPNAHGTAPGLYFSPECTASDTPVGTHLFLLPGPPRELHPMFLNEVVPRLRTVLAEAAQPPRSMRIYRVCAMGESAVEEKIGKQIEEEGLVEVGYCARPNEVDLRLIGDDADIERWHTQILLALGENLFTFGEQSMEERVVSLLQSRALTVATAESCTGGLLAHRITNVPGASEVFHRGYVTYSNEAKETLLGVSADLLLREGAVSSAVAAAMAEGALLRSASDFALSTTGIAGPGGGSPAKPVGTVYFGLAEKGKPTLTWNACYPMDRESFKQVASQSALDKLRRRLCA